MPTKKYKFDFFECVTKNTSASGPEKSPKELFDALLLKHNTGVGTHKTVGSSNYEIRYIEQTSTGFNGIIGKHRVTDLPHAAVIGGSEREISLEPNENLLEKAYFSFFSDHSLIILQRNIYCINGNNFGKYLSQSEEITFFNPIIESADLKLLMNNHVQIRTAKVQIARPRNPVAFQSVQHDFNNSIISTLNGSNAAVINLSLRGNARSDVKEERYLASTMKGALTELLTKFDVKQCKVLVENDETYVAHPIDLVADRLCYEKEIVVSGRYPPEYEMWAALAEARTTNESELESYFGRPGSPRLS